MPMASSGSDSKQGKENDSDSEGMCRPVSAASSGGVNNR